MKNETVDPHNELDFKTYQIRKLIEKRGVDAVLLQRVSSFSWATCGADSHINVAASDGVASLLITSQDRFLLTNNIEAARLEHEQHISDQNWTFEVSPWHENGDVLEKMVGGMQIGSDGLYQKGVELSREIAWLRAQLTSHEIDRFRNLSSLCAASMQGAINKVVPGMSEHHIAGLLAQEAESRGVQAIVKLVATDERISAYRHPLPTENQLQKFAMLVLCGRKWGLICSITRLIHFGKMSDELRKKSQAVASIDADIIAFTRPGRMIADAFQHARDAYSRFGYADEWKNHHQGGLAGYEPREITATDSTHEPIAVNQVYAWNPSVSGAKSEDSMLVGEVGNEILTEIPDWPMMEIQTDFGTIRRPHILEKE